MIGGKAAAIVKSSKSDPRGANWGVEWLARDAKCRDMVTVALRDCTYSATDEAQAASLANIDDFLGYVMNAGEVVEMLKRK